VLQRQDLATVRLGPQHGLFQVLEEPLCDARAFDAVGYANLKLDSRRLSVTFCRSQQDHVANPTLFEEPKSGLQAADRFRIPDVHVFILRRNQDCWIVLAGHGAVR